jgi:Family of unknown function (DUF6600)/FecR protein
MSRLFLFALATAASSSLALASEDGFVGARVRYVENGVTLQRASEPAAEEAAANLPFLPGDRIWTDDRGRIELQFAAGSQARVDSRSKIDFVAVEGDQNDRVVLRLWAGAMILHAGGRGSASFAIETPAGLVEAGESSLLRVDFDEGEARLSVYEGEATAVGSRGRAVDVEAGERTYVSGGEAPEVARSFDTRRNDDFDDWSVERESLEVVADRDRRPLPPEVAPYAGELEANGSWDYVGEVGYVWRPSVGADWQPYLDGRWDWSSYGWVWVAGEPWGWATSHYGRWGYSSGVGWYWMPGSVWAPAWVSWAVGDDYVGWCPLGRGDVPVSVERGHAVPRGSVGPGAAASSWVYARKADVRAPDVARRRVALGSAEVRELRTVPHARPTRDFQRIADGPVAVPRNVNVKPTIGDFVPELGTDNRVTIPVRAPARSVRERRDASWDRNQTGAPRRATAPVSGDGSRKAIAPTGGVSAMPRERENDSESRRLAEPDREVLRRIFRPVTEPQQREKAPASGETHSGGDSARSAAPRREPGGSGAHPSPVVHSAPQTAPRAPHAEPRSKQEH